MLGSALPRATADTLLLSSCSCQLTPSVAAPAGASSPLLLLLLLLQVPADQVATTPVQLYATAGLRALPNDTSARLLAAVAGTLASSGFRWGQGWGEGGGGVVEAAAGDALQRSCRRAQQRTAVCHTGIGAVSACRCLHVGDVLVQLCHLPPPPSCRFQPGWARIASGREEGLWGWLGVNYARGALGGAVRGGGATGGGRGRSSRRRKKVLDGLLAVCAGMVSKHLLCMRHTCQCSTCRCCSHRPTACGSHDHAPQQAI